MHVVYRAEWNDPKDGIAEGYPEYGYLVTSEAAARGQFDEAKAKGWKSRLVSQDTASGPWTVIEEFTPPSPATVERAKERE